MISIRYISISLLTALLYLTASVSFAQDVVTLDPYNVAQEGLVAQINADKAANGDIIPDGRIYELVGGGIYLNRQVLYVEANETLNIRSSSDEKPIVYQYQTGTGDSPSNPPGYLFRSRGGDMNIDGIAVSGYYEPGDEGNEDYDELYTVQGGLLRTDNPGASITVTNSIFSNIAGQVLRTEGATETIRFEDVIFANLGALSTSNFGAGKGIDLRATSVDSLIMINNTFVNYQDRPIRHYNFGDPTAGTGEIGYGLFDHNTFVNGMGFHGVLSLGTVGDDIIITNNLFVDAFAAGEDSTDGTRTAEWANTGEQYDNGNNRMAWIFANPNANTNWVVENNYYAVSSEGQGFFDQYDEINVGEPLSIYIRDALGDDADDAFTMIDDPGMANIPNLMTGLMTYYVDIADKTKDTPNDVWDPAIHDMDRRTLTYFVNNFDASYATTSDAYTGAANDFPAGDLNWFPAQKNDWVTTSIDDISGPGGDLPQSISLNQNYPNPFNPSTTISYDLTQPSNVQLEVYDVLGKKVATLVDNNFKSAGSHIVNFDANSLSSGLYIYILKAEGMTYTRKMTLLK